MLAAVGITLRQELGIHPVYEKLLPAVLFGLQSPDARNNRLVDGYPIYPC